MADTTLAEPALPPGLKMAREIMTPDEEAALIALIENSGLERVKREPTNPRSTRTFGWVYEIADESIWLGDPLPPAFHPLRDRAAAFVGVKSDDLVECMLIRYEPGATIPPHQDKPAWTNIIGISLGAETMMTFRKPEGDGYRHTEVKLLPRSIYAMTGEARYVYQHGLPPVEGRRWSITFRDLSEVGMAMRDRSLSG